MALPSKYREQMQKEAEMKKTGNQADAMQPVSDASQDDPVEQTRAIYTPHIPAIPYFENIPHGERRQRFDSFMAHLRKIGHEGYYEYKVIKVMDKKKGVIDDREIQNQLVLHGLQGWRVVTSFSNEVVSSTAQVGVGRGMSVGAQASLDQSVFILERYLPVPPKDNG